MTRLAMISLMGFLMLSHTAMAAGKDDVSAKEAVEDSEEDAEEAPAKPVKAAKKPAAKVEKKEEKVAKPDAKKEAKPEAKEALACPESITVEEQKLDKKHTPAGFGYFAADVKYWLETVSVYAGDKKITVVEPAKSTESLSFWPLTDNGKTHYWLGCAYKHTSVVLKKPLDEKLRSCHVGPKANPMNPHGPLVLHAFGCE